jgi:hypothetical protein
LPAHSRFTEFSISLRTSARMAARVRGGRSSLKMTTDRRALAWSATASSARATLPHTPTARNPTISANRMPIGGSIPGEMAFNAAARSPSASRITTA